MKKLIAAAVLLLGLGIPAKAETIKWVHNTFTGKLDAITKLSTSTIKAGTGIVVTTNTTGGVTVTATGGAGTPAGSDTQVQYNNAGAFGGSASFTWNGTTVTATGVSGTTVAATALLEAAKITNYPNTSLALELNSGSARVNVLSLSSDFTTGDTWQASSTLNIWNGAGDAKFTSGGTFRGASVKGWTISNGGSLDAGLTLACLSESRDEYVNFKGTLASDSSGGNLWYRPANLLFTMDRNLSLSNGLAVTYGVTAGSGTFTSSFTVISTFTAEGHRFSVFNSTTNDILTVNSAGDIVNTPAYTVYWREKEFTTPTNVSTNTAFYTTTSTNPWYGKPSFTVASSSNTTYVEYDTFVPTYISTNSDPVANLTIRLGGTDTGSHKFFIEMADLASGGSFDSPTYINTIGITVAADGSGTLGKVEVAAGVTLTGWGASFTKQHAWKIRLKNDQSGTSTVNPFVTNLTIDIPLTRP